MGRIVTGYRVIIVHTSGWSRIVYFDKEKSEAEHHVALLSNPLPLASGPVPVLAEGWSVRLEELEQDEDDPFLELDEESQDAE